MADEPSRVDARRMAVRPVGAVATAQEPPRLLRRDGGRVVGGVAGGVADHLGIDVLRVRIVFVVLTALAGAGLAAYALLWFFCPPGTDTRRPSAAERRQAYGLALIGLVLMAVIGFASAGTPAANLVPFVFVAIGASLVWREFDTSRMQRRATVLTWTRLAGGVVLVVGGLVFIVLVGEHSLGGLSATLLAVLATLIGVVLLTVPLWMRMWRALNEERAARIRDAEREEIASHLHDSVLQTLALIQKQASRPEEVTRLARSQERQLRTWLFGDSAGHDSSLSASIKSVCGEVEDDYGLEIDVITVGDLRPDDEPSSRRRRWAGLVSATRESLINAAKHSGERKVSVYCEVSDDQVEVFVRDRGKGFDPADVDDDRQGIARSIRGRMDRFGGTAVIDSAPGRGTNVTLRMPRTDHDAARDPADREESVDREMPSQEPVREEEVGDFE